MIDKKGNFGKKVSANQPKTKEAPEMIAQYELKANDVHAYTLKMLKEHLPIQVDGYICQTKMILNVLIKASAENSSLEAVCADLEEVADSNTIREYLNAALPIQELREQEGQVNRALAGCIPDDLVRTAIEVAIDLHDEPCYGKQEEIRQVTCSSQAKKGTTHFVRIATAYIIWRQVRLTLAVQYVLPEETAFEILKFLLNRLKKLGFQAKVLYLDRGFASTGIIRYLSAQPQPAIIACPIRGKQGGTCALCCGRSSYSTKYTFTDGTQTTIAMKASLVPDASGKIHRKWLAFILVLLDWKPDKVYEEYRRRFGVECSYRLLRRIRASTTSRNPSLRFFLLGIGLILVNAWAFLRWTFARRMGRGPRRVDVSRFRFNRFSKFLIRTVEEVYGTISAISSTISPQSMIY